MGSIDIKVEDGTLLNNPQPDNKRIFFDSNNNDILTVRDEFGVDKVFPIGSLENRILVREATDFGTIDSTKEYFLDGVIDMTGVSIEVPSGGINITGYNLEISGLTCSDNSYTMFTSPAGGSGSVVFKDFYIEVDGTGSQVFDLVADTGFEALEWTRINFNNCTSRGEVDGYRQGFEEGCGYFGGSPSLTLSGNMLGGYVFKSSIVRSLDDSWTGALFQEGTSLTINSRFFSDANIDLGTNSSFIDFRTTNFALSSSVQLKDMFISRNGTVDPTDTNIIPNILASDLVSIWRTNQGIDNTYVGGRLEITSELPTIITAAGTFTNVLGVFTASDLQHFSEPSNGQLRNDGVSPRDFKVIFGGTVDGGSGDDVEVKIVKHDDSAGTDSDVVSLEKSIENNVGGSDTSDYFIYGNVTLDVNDYVFLQIANNTDTTTVTLKAGAYLIVEER